MSEGGRWVYCGLFFFSFLFCLSNSMRKKKTQLQESYSCGEAEEDQEGPFPLWMTRFVLCCGGGVVVGRGWTLKGRALKRELIQQGLEIRDGAHAGPFAVLGSPSGVMHARPRWPRHRNISCGKRSRRNLDMPDGGEEGMF